MWLLSVYFSVFILSFASGSWKPTVYQKIRQTAKLSYFYSLLESNRPAKINLQYGEVTVFVPTNEAFEWFSGNHLEETVNYHMIWYARVMKDIKSGSISTVIEESPPLWITRLEDDIYVNNARIIPELSDYVSEINNKPKKPQILHVIDEVLDPIIRRTSQAIYKPTAFDFLSYPQFWNLGYVFDMFSRKIIGNRQESIFKTEGNFTFFVPIDEGFTDYRLQMLDANVIASHVIPNRVLFTRPSPKDTPFETLANDESFYVVLIISQTEGKMYVKSHTLIGDSNHPAGELTAEIVKPNIPVKNGVMHLIKRPLVVFDRRLTLFPFLPIASKLSTDPTLNFTYSLANRNGFTRILGDEKRKFTFFIPRDKAWSNLANVLEVNSTFVHNFILKYSRAILSRHIIMSNVSFTMEDLRNKNLNSADMANINLPTLGGVLKIGIGERDGQYLIFWRNQVIPVHRSNYYCTNGIVHIVDGFFINEEDFDVEESNESSQTNPLHLLNMLFHITL